MARNLSDDEWTCYIVFIFTGVRTSTDRIIDLFSVGEEVHVDVGIFDTVKKENNGVLYSSYVGQAVKKTIALENNYNETLDKLLVSSITRGQAKNALALLNACTEAHIKYNTRDLFFCVYPKLITDVFVSDIPSIENIQSVFCSQLAILASRELKYFNSISGTLECHPLVGATSAINSRTNSPARLKRIVAPFCQRAHLRKFMRGHLDFIRH